MAGPVTDVWAHNPKTGEKRRFTRMSWNFMGANKEGWVELPDTIIHNTVTPKKEVVSKPSTGNSTTKKEQVIENTAGKKKDVIIENALTTKKEDDDKANAGNGNNENVVTEEQKAEFEKAADGLKKGDIKDFFDKREPKVEYSNAWKPNQFIEKLGEVLNYDIVALQKIFN